VADVWLTVRRTFRTFRRLHAPLLSPLLLRSSPLSDFFCFTDHLPLLFIIPSARNSPRHPTLPNSCSVCETGRRHAWKELPRRPAIPNRSRSACCAWHPRPNSLTASWSLAKGLKVNQDSLPPLLSFHLVITLHSSPRPPSRLHIPPHAPLLRPPSNFDSSTLCFPGPTFSTATHIAILPSRCAALSTLSRFPTSGPAPLHFLQSGPYHPVPTVDTRSSTSSLPVTAPASASHRPPLVSPTVPDPRL
jgi:hypothetical protein